MADNLDNKPDEAPDVFEARRAAAPPAAREEMPGGFLGWLLNMFMSLFPQPQENSGVAPSASAGRSVTSAATNPATTTARSAAPVVSETPAAPAASAQQANPSAVEIIPPPSSPGEIAPPAPKPVPKPEDLHPEKAFVLSTLTADPEMAKDIVEIKILGKSTVKFVFKGEEITVPDKKRAKEIAEQITTHGIMLDEYCPPTVRIGFGEFAPSIKNNIPIFNAAEHNVLLWNNEARNSKRHAVVGDFIDQKVWIFEDSEGTRLDPINGDAKINAVNIAKNYQTLENARIDFSLQREHTEQARELAARQARLAAGVGSSHHSTGGSSGGGGYAPITPAEQAFNNAAQAPAVFNSQMNSAIQGINSATGGGSTINFNGSSSSIYIPNNGVPNSRPVVPRGHGASNGTPSKDLETVMTSGGLSRIVVADLEHQSRPAFPQLKPAGEEMIQRVENDKDAVIKVAQHYLDNHPDDQKLKKTLQEIATQGPHVGNNGSNVPSQPAPSNGVVADRTSSRTGS